MMDLGKKRKRHEQGMERGCYSFFFFLQRRFWMILGLFWGFVSVMNFGNGWDGGGTLKNGQCIVSNN